MNLKSGKAITPLQIFYHLEGLTKEAKQATLTQWLQSTRITITP